MIFIARGDKYISEFFCMRVLPSKAVVYIVILIRWCRFDPSRGLWIDSGEEEAACLFFTCERPGN